jgi:hypothetical protein
MGNNVVIKYYFETQNNILSNYNIIYYRNTLYRYNLMDNIFSKDNIIVLGEAILLASMQFSIGSVEMSSKFSVKNFSKDQETLQNAADALSDYMKIGILWTIGLSILFYARYDKFGAAMTVIINILIIAWIYFSYINAFDVACKNNNLKCPIVTILW